MKVKHFFIFIVFFCHAKNNIFFYILRHTYKYNQETMLCCLCSTIVSALNLFCSLFFSMRKADNLQVAGINPRLRRCRRIEWKLACVARGFVLLTDNWQIHFFVPSCNRIYVELKRNKTKKSQQICVKCKLQTCN